MRHHLIVVCCLAGPAFAAAGEPWTYMSSLVDADDAPLPRALTLSDSPPPDLDEGAAGYRGHARRYAQLTYGTPDSTGVALVVDDLAGGGFDLYIDADRDRVIQPADRLADDGPVRHATVPMMHVAGDPLAGSFVERTVVFERGPGGRSLRYATAGCLATQLRIGDRMLAVRRFDADGNGRFADDADRLWIDLNGDGRWDPFGEQFLCTPVVRLGTERYALDADAIGDACDLTPLLGVGRVRVVVRPVRDVPLLDARVVLIGGDGGVVTIRAAGNDEAREVPAGDYRVSSVVIRLADPAGGASWSYAFSASDRARLPWHTVTADDRTDLPVLDDSKFEIAMLSASLRTAPGGSFNVRPQWTTAEGHYVTGCWRGDRSDLESGPTAAIDLDGEAATPLFTCRTGFRCGTFCAVAVRVPESAPEGPLLVRARFDSGPLAGVLEAESPIQVAR